MFSLKVGGIVVLASVCDFVCAASVALAKDAPPDNQFRVAPYVWATVLDADLGLGPLSLSISMDAEEMFSYADYGAMGYPEWRSGNHFLFADGTVAGMNTDQFEPFFNAPMQADFKVVEAGYGHRFALEQDLGPVRALTFSPHLSVLSGGLEGEVSGMFDFDIDYDWTGLALGGTVDAHLGDKLTFTLRAVHSGFSGDLDNFLNVLVGARLPLTDRTALAIGYRIARASYSHQDATMDIELSGALLGVEMRW